MFVPVAVFYILNAASAITVPKINTTANESQAASVQEVSQPPMTVQNAVPQDYLLPGYYAFNKGEPFFVEKDPLTGAIDFNKKTTPTGSDKVESNTSSGVVDDKGVSGPTATESDYFYDDQEVEGDGIDRKDGSLQGPSIYRPNEIFQNPYKISPDLHQFLNLPVHYSSSDKFPLISSSYANTKIQGTGSSSNTYSNHKYVTTSTQSPSYYTMPTTKYSTRKPQYHSTAATTTTTTSKPSSTTTEAEEEYENTDYEYEGEDSGGFLDNQAVPSEYHTQKPETTKYTVTTYRPTTYKYTTTKPTTTSALPTTEKSTQQVSIVTSLPVDVYYSTSQEPSTQTKTSSTLQSTSSSSTTDNSSTTINYNSIGNSTSKPSTENNKLIQNQSEYLSNEGYFSGFGEEPFRPIFGPGDTSFKHESNNQIQYNQNEFLKPKPTEVNEFQRLPPQQNNPYIQRPQTLPPQMEPPRPGAQQSYFPDQPVKLVPGQHASISFGDPTKINSVSRPVPEYERPPLPPSKYHPQESIPLQNRPDIQPVYEGRPVERPISTVRPRPNAEIPIKTSFKTPSKIESHFIKVSPDQENPSYSLQTSFSIGVPSGQGDKEQPETHPSQGVGQVFFPDNTPAENSLPEANANLNLPSQVLRPPNNRIPVQSYQPNRPGYRQPIHAQTRPPPPFRLPNEDLHPPSEETDHYPRPHWENHSKPFFGQSPNTIPKKEIILPQYYPGLNRGKPEHIQRPDLPNILPQFRPNAKVGHSEYHQTFSPPGDKVKEPVDTLQPPPLPQPQHLRINRNDDESEVDREFLTVETKGEPLVHRRSGPQPGRVTTLQMMQQTSQRKTSDVPDTRQASDKDKPVFVVYPSAHGMTLRPTHDEAVVIGTRAQRPLPPANLEKDDLDTFPLDDNKHFPIPGRDRVDTPILKTKVTKPIVKHEFPYAIVKPNTNNMAEERILVPSSSVKEYTEFSPTPSSSTEETKDHDSEINLIPYLQDYMPFATKKPQLVKQQSSIKTDLETAQKPIQLNHVISTTLNASLAKTSIEKVAQKKVDTEEKDGSEMTVSATMYTQQRPSNHKVPVTYTPSEPQPQGFQAPFMASLSAPQSHGWSVITDKTLQPTAEEPTPESEKVDGDDTKFDIEHFKPQLFGGFKPILPSSEEEPGLVAGTTDKDKDVLISKADREE